MGTVLGQPPPNNLLYKLRMVQCEFCGAGILSAPDHREHNDRECPQSRFQLNLKIRRLEDELLHAESFVFISKSGVRYYASYLNGIWQVYCSLKKWEHFADKDSALARARQLADEGGVE